MLYSVLHVTLLKHVLSISNELLNIIIFVIAHCSSAIDYQ